MSGHAEVEGHLPRPETILGIMDDEARAAVQNAGDALLEHVHLEAPGSGRLADTFTRRIGKTTTGQQVTVQPGRRTAYGTRGQTSAKVVRWVSRGTGIFRTTGLSARPATRIHGKRGRPMVLPGGKRRYTVAGQRPNPFFERARDRAEPDVERELAQGHARTVERLKRLT